MDEKTENLEPPYQAPLGPSVVAALFEVEKHFNRVHRNHPEGDKQLFRDIKKTLIAHKEKN